MKFAWFVSWILYIILRIKDDCSINTLKLSTSLKNSRSKVTTNKFYKKKKQLIESYEDNYLTNFQIAKLVNLNPFILFWELSTLSLLAVFNLHICTLLHRWSEWTRTCAHQEVERKVHSWHRFLSYFTY